MIVDEVPLTTGRSPTRREYIKYTKTDFRWVMVVSLEILTVLSAGLLCFYVIHTSTIELNLN